MDLQKNWLIMIGTCAMILLVNLDMTIVNLALPTITKTLHRPLTTTQWIISIYLFAATIFFVVCGRLADKFGKKTLFLIGTLCFLISSIVLSLTNNLTLMLAMRFIQGIGFAATLNLALLINTEIYSANKHGFAIGISITLSGLGQAFGPTIAGFILSITTWHWLFAINIPFCCLAIFCVSKFYVEKVMQKPAGKFIDMKVFKLENYNMVIWLRATFMFCWAIMLFCLPIYLENYLHFSALKSGFVIFSMTAILGICSFFVGLALDKIGATKPMMSAIICALASFIFLILSINYQDMSLLYVSLVLFGLNVGLMLPSSVFAAMHALPPEQKGLGMGIFFTLSFFSAAVGTSMASYLLVSLPTIAAGLILATVIMLIVTIAILLIFLRARPLLPVRVL